MSSDAPSHVCWVYRQTPELRRGAAAFLAEGLDAGQRLGYLGAGSVDQSHRNLRAVAQWDPRIEAEDITVHSLDQVYGAGEVVDPDTQVAAYAKATDDALARGYTGLRVVAEATPLVRTAAQREAFARYELLVDRYMLDHPFFAMCAYDLRELGEVAAAEIACLHPAVNNGATTFRWCSTRAADIGLAGEIDVASHDVFDVTLTRTMPILPRPRLLVDAHELEFIDHRGLLALDRSARGAGTEVLLRTDAVIIHRLAKLLDLGAVRTGWFY